MNVKDFDSQLPEGDFLKAIFEKQHQLMEKYDPIESKNMGYQIPTGVLDLSDPKAQVRLKDFAWRITEEIGEAMNCLKNKPWKQTQMVTDETHYLEELVDGLHFYIELLIHSGFTPESLVKMYLNKSAVNEFRIRSQY